MTKDLETKHTIQTKSSRRKENDLEEIKTLGLLLPLHSSI